MGTLTGQNILDRQRDLVQDVSAVRWLDPEALRWINDGIRDLVFKKPLAYTRRTPFSLGGTAKQNIASTLPRAFAIVDVIFNLDAVSNPSSAIRKVGLDAITALNANWATESGETVKHWMPDVEPHTFYVYPGKPKTGVTRVVELVYAETPSELTSLSSVIPIDDVYANALGYYLAFRLYSKDADGAASPAAAQAYYTLFTNSLGA